MLLEVTKAIVGLGLLSIIAMYAQFLNNTLEYQRLSRGSAKMWGNIRYSLDRTLRGFWADINEIEDKLRGTEVKVFRYF